MKVPLDLFVNWLRMKNLKDKTIQHYSYYFNKFLPYDKFTQETISHFLSINSNQNKVCRGFINNFRKFLMVNYKALGITEEELKDISAVELPQLTGRVKQRLINPIPHDQIPLLEKALETEKLKIMLLLSYYCGLRLSELLKITILSFNWELWKKDLSKMGELKVYGKGSKEGLAFVPPVLMHRISDYIKNTKFQTINDKLFKSAYKDKIENSARSWQKKLAEAGIKSGITRLDEAGKPLKDTVVHPHRLRHSLGSYLINDKSMDIRSVQEVLRHSSIQSTQIYTQIDKEKLKEKLKTNI